MTSNKATVQGLEGLRKTPGVSLSDTLKERNRLLLLDPSPPAEALTALDLALAISSGDVKGWRGFSIELGPVLLVTKTMSSAAVVSRSRELRPKDPESGYKVTFSTDGRIRLDNESEDYGLRWLSAQIGDIALASGSPRATLLLDPLSLFVDDTDPESSLEALEKLSGIVADLDASKYEAQVVLIHHPGRHFERVPAWLGNLEGWEVVVVPPADD